MLDVDVHPSSLNFLDVLSLKPPKEDRPPEFGHRDFLLVVEVLVESLPQILR